MICPAILIYGVLTAGSKAEGVEKLPQTGGIDNHIADATAQALSIAKDYGKPCGKSPTLQNSRNIKSAPSLQGQRSRGANSAADEECCEGQSTMPNLPLNPSPNGQKGKGEPATSAPVGDDGEVSLAGCEDAALLADSKSSQRGPLPRQNWRQKSRACSLPPEAAESGKLEAPEADQEPKPKR